MLDSGGLAWGRCGVLRRLLLATVALFAVCTLCESPPVALGTFNIRTFPTARTDHEAVARAIAELDADAFAVQEIVDARAFDAVLARASALTGRQYRAALHLAPCPRRDGEMLIGVVHDAREWTLVQSRVLGEYTCPKGQPAGAVALLRADDGRRLALTTVHMTAGDGTRARDERRAQWRWLVDELPELREELQAPVVVAGDFNSTGYLRAGDAERGFIDETLERRGLQLASESLGCSMYWRPDNFKQYQAGLLDHVLAEDGLELGAAEALGMCAELACAPQANEPAARAAVSDHCPVRVSLKL